MLDILIVGQIPPPVNGQTLMIKSFLDGKYDHIRLHHVPMKFSRSIDEVGTFQIRKLFVLFNACIEVFKARSKTGATAVYFPPAGPAFVPVIRDILLHIGTRWMFRYTIFHFHAAGLTEIYPRLPAILRPFFRIAYYKPDVAIFTAESRFPMGVEIKAKNIVAVPYGIDDNAGQFSLDRSTHEGQIPTILFMGILCDGKGLFTLIEACALLHAAHVPFKVVCGGTWDAETSQQDVEALIDRHGMNGMFHFPGVLLGDEKFKAFRDADVFCFPSHYINESSPVVLTEAMSFQLPIVTTNWRGIPDVVGKTGGAFLVEPKRPDLVADSLRKLFENKELRKEMGQKNRAWFSAFGTTEKYRQNMELAVLKAEAGPLKSRQNLPQTTT